MCEHTFVMRWDNLLTEAEEAQTLPGYRDPAVIRRFDAPEAMNVRFYEVRSKSALNRVPKQSRMPFRWTINPYRGCSHACVYCSHPETPVLMADGITRPIGDLRPGDEIYGTVPDARYRRYAVTRVLDRWETRKEAYRVFLEDGTELIASGDHRFLSDRGWKFVTGTECGRSRRPHLTLNNKLIGVGAFASPPQESEDYRRGYLCGLIRGDGSIGTYSYDRPGRTHGLVHRFRLALCDLEALRRAQEYLLEAGVATDGFEFHAATATQRAARAIRTQSGPKVEAVREVIRWPWSPSSDWRKGFLAGIFDAEGCWSRGVLRIANTDDAIIGQTTECLRRMGFDFVVEDRGLANRIRNVRIRGGLREHLRFFLCVDPAITRKRTFEGTALKSDAPLRVVAIEPLGRDMDLVDITTGTGDFIANGVVSHNCFARPTHTYLDFNAREDFEREIVVKVNLPEVLRAELARPSWKREHVALGTNTDPYQWVEGRYKLMPEVWEALLAADTPCSVLTKSPLLVRDIDVMRRLNERVGFTANVSVPTIDEAAWRASEPHTPHPRKRLEALAELHRAGIPTGVLVAPLMPGINDDPKQVEKILELAGEAGAGYVTGIALHLRGEVRSIVMDWLRSYRPDLVEHYEQLYARSAYAPRAEQDRLMALTRRNGAKRPAGARGIRRSTGHEAALKTRERSSEKNRPRQESLF
jgi:DNA repair photolyase